jgi:hypothetical protein
MMSKRSPKSSSAEKAPSAVVRRRAYHAPKLTDYGPVAKLTQNNPTGSFADGMGRKMAMSCL